MYFQHCVIEAIEQVLAWELPDEMLGQAVYEQAGLIARIEHDQISDCCLD